MKMSCRYVAVSLACGAALTLTFINAHADDDYLWPIEQRFNADLGVFLIKNDTSVRVDGSTTEGTDINLQNEFGFDNQNRFRVDGYWRFLDRHKLRFLYFGSRASTDRIIDETIVFDNVTYPINSTVHAEFDTDIIELAYEYSFVRRNNFEISGTVGLHNFSITTRLNAQASSNGTGVDLSSSAKGEGPLPVIGLRGIWALSDHFYFDAQAQFFSLKFDNYKGSLQDYKVTFTWQPFRNVGIGIGYNDFKTRLDVTQSDFEGRLDFGYSGALGFIAVAF